MLYSVITLVILTFIKSFWAPQLRFLKIYFLIQSDKFCTRSRNGQAWETWATQRETFLSKTFFPSKKAFLYLPGNNQFLKRKNLFYLPEKTEFLTKEKFLILYPNLYLKNFLHLLQKNNFPPKEETHKLFEKIANFLNEIISLKKQFSKQKNSYTYAKKKYFFA